MACYPGYCSFYFSHIYYSNLFNHLTTYCLAWNILILASAAGWILGKSYGYIFSGILASFSWMVIKPLWRDSRTGLAHSAWWTQNEPWCPPWSLYLDWPAHKLTRNPPVLESRHSSFITIHRINSAVYSYRFPSSWVSEISLQTCNDWRKSWRTWEAGFKSQWDSKPAYSSPYVDHRTIISKVSDYLTI